MGHCPNALLIKLFYQTPILWETFHSHSHLFILLLLLLLLLLLCNVFILKVYEEQCEVENVNFEIGRMRTCEDSSKASHPLLVGILLIALLLLWF